MHLGLAQGLATRAARAQTSAAPRVGLVPFAGPHLCVLTIDGPGADTSVDTGGRPA